MTTQPAISNVIRRTCRVCGTAVELSGLVAYCSLGPWDLCDLHYAEWFRDTYNRKDPT